MWMLTALIVKRKIEAPNDLQAWFPAEFLYMWIINFQILGD